MEQVELNDIEDADVAIQEWGSAGERALVIEDFYRDPDRVRELALAQGDWQPQRYFPGLRAVIPADTSRLFQELVRWIAIEGIRPESECSGKLVFSMTTHRDADIDPMNAGVPHFDHHSDLAGLVYLNLPEQCRGGTAFYRHRVSGLARWPWKRAVQREVAQALGVSAADKTDQELGDALWSYHFDPPGERPRRYLRGSNETWEMTQLLEMKYNRAIFYETDLFHAMYTHDDYFGEDPASRRLTQTMFLRVERS